MRQLGLALSEFEVAYGSFPSETTIQILKTEFAASTIPLGTTTANEYFRQLLVAEIVPSEICFDAWPGPRPDNIFDGIRALEKGECAFAYIKNVSPSNAPETPVVVYPLLNGKLIFDYELCKQWGERVPILRRDNSVITLPVDKSGHVYLNGKDLFDPAQPFWGGKVPDVKWPE